jgi:hypothetical protein
MKLVAEVVPGKLVEHEIAAIERPDEILPASFQDGDVRVGVEQQVTGPSPRISV